MWEPGKSGNPAGRPKKGTALTDILASKVDKEAMAQMLIDKAASGDVIAMKYIYDRIDGKPVETINQSVVEAPKVIEIVHTEDKADTEDIPTVEE